MPKGKGEWPRLYMYFPCNLEDRLKADALLANISITVPFGGVANGTNGSDIAFREAILIGINDDPIWVNLKGQKRNFAIRCRYGVRIILRILN